MRPVLPSILLAIACTPPPDMNGTPRSEARPGDTPDSVRVLPIHHSALAVQWHDRTILVDPHGDPQRFAAFHDPDLVLITDIHGDHLDSATLRSIDLTNTDLVVPQAVHDQLPADMQQRCVVLANGGIARRKEVGIRAIPMYNLPGPEEGRHPKGRGNGYVLTLGDTHIYISGDTEDIPEMRALRDIDIAFVCMNLPYTMTVDQAASGVLAFKPKVVYPYHYRGQDGLSDVGRFKEIVQAGDPHIEVRLVDWYGDR
ncbi:MAG: MBL fold metallo-hydrolase [Flavobacteriales bacterium]|nr:MBL fold metallo-hydrolase [Flavobacteriales bacterium]MCB9168434.1 MBL fold metallo-hydrolase [Flavobacteriales bacterium]